MMRKVLDNDAAWMSGFKDVCLSIFDRISGGDGEMDIEEFERWLRRDTKTHGPDVGFMKMQPSSSLPKIQAPRLHAKTDRAKRVSRAKEKEQGLPPSISLPSLSHRSRARRTRISEESMDSFSLPHGSHGVPKEVHADSLSGRALAARWLLPNASTAKVLAVESDVQLPVLLDGPVWTPKWRLFGGSPTDSPQTNVKSLPNKKKEAPPNSEAQTQSGASGQVKSKLTGPAEKPPLSISPSWDSFLHDASNKMAEAMKRAPLSPPVQR